MGDATVTLTRPPPSRPERLPASSKVLANTPKKPTAAGSQRRRESAGRIRHLARLPSCTRRYFIQGTTPPPPRDRNLSAAFRRKRVENKMRKNRGAWKRKRAGTRKTTPKLLCAPFFHATPSSSRSSGANRRRDAFHESRHPHCLGARTGSALHWSRTARVRMPTARHLEFQNVQVLMRLWLQSLLR